jgi:hypothetical protein
VRVAAGGVFFSVTTYHQLSRSYVKDAYGDRWSRLTFLIYLNDGCAFEGGCTTFFIPAATVGVLDAWPVKPVAGSVMAFPHGDTGGALLHEGSAVFAGEKQIIRTDVLYYTSAASNADGDQSA